MKGNKKRFYNKCWGSEAERQSYAQHFSLLLEKRVEHRKKIL